MNISRQGDVIASVATGVLVMAMSPELFRIQTQPSQNGQVWHVGFKHGLSKTAQAVDVLFKAVLGFGLLYDDAKIVFPSPRKEDQETKPRIVFQRKKCEWVTLETTSLRGRSPAEVVLRKEEIPLCIVEALSKLYDVMKSE